MHFGNFAVLLALPLALDARLPMSGSSSGLPSIESNDNRAAAGTLSNGVLTVRLDARIGEFRPEGEHNPPLTVYAFGEEGKPLQAPGPMIRVTAGTPVHLTLRNSLPKMMRVRGLTARPGLDSLDIAPGASREVTFTPMHPGTYFYSGRTDGNRAGAGFWNDGELSGALIVDPPGARRADRVMLISILGNLSDSLMSEKAAPFHLFVNGRSWPYTERLTYSIGDSVHWRVINASTAPHPMHLHGFYFRVESRGDNSRDSIFTADQQRLAVTELMMPNTTMALSWVPDRPGNWVFHCHFIAHISTDQRLGDVSTVRRELNHGMHNHALEGMAGLVMGITVLPPKHAVPRRVSTVTPDRRTLFINERPNVFGGRPGFSFILQHGPNPPASDSMRLPGSPIFLTRGVPAEITVHNRTRDMTSVHWHGIELETYYDGVGDWSGSGSHTAPPIGPGKTFVVKFTPDRAGTFIYHTHSDEDKQLSSGLYGPLIILEPGQKYDADADRILLLAAGGPREDATPMINGRIAPPPMELRTGKTYRLRFINISPASGKVVRLLSGKTVQSWRAFAKDGASLPPAQATNRPAQVMMASGETWDFELTPATAGGMTLEVTTVRRNVPPTRNVLAINVR